MAEPTPTNPGLTYDPRNSASAKFWAGVEKAIAGLPGGEAPRGTTKKGLQPLPDPGQPMTADFPNPRYKAKTGFAIRV